MTILHTGQTVSSMNKRRRVRALIRQHHWTPVDVDDETQSYWEMRTWCANTFEKDTWEGSLRGMAGARFVFANGADALVFQLKWGYENRRYQPID